MDIFSFFTLYALLFGLIWLYSFITTLSCEFNGSNTRIIWILALIFLPLSAFLFLFIGRNQISSNSNFSFISFLKNVFSYVFFFVILVIVIFFIQKGIKLYFPEFKFTIWNSFLLGIVVWAVIGVTLYLISLILHFTFKLFENPIKVRKLKKEANAGNANSQNILAVMYHDGKNGLEKDMNKAIYWYKKAAENNSIWGMYNLAELYYSGEYISMNYIKALDLYLKASKENHSDSLNRLGQIFQFGYGIDVDYDKAFEYYKRASELDNPSALFNLSLCYKKGLGTEIDLSKYKKYLALAEKQGNVSSMLELGILYKNEDNSEMALKYLEKASSKNNSSAYLQIGYIYFYGIGDVSINYDIALDYFDKSSKLGNSIAKAYYSEVVLKKLSKNKDYKKANSFLSDALKDNIKKAQDLKQELNI